MHIAIKEATNEKLMKVLSNLYAEILEDGGRVTVHYPNGTIVGYEYEPEWKLLYNFGKELSGPGALTCDCVGTLTEEDCKTCVGTGSCRYGKTEEEFQKLKGGKL